MCVGRINILSFLLNIAQFISVQFCSHWYLPLSTTPLRNNYNFITFIPKTKQGRWLKLQRLIKKRSESSSQFANQIHFLSISWRLPLFVKWICNIRIIWKNIIHLVLKILERSTAGAFDKGFMIFNKTLLRSVTKIFRNISLRYFLFVVIVILVPSARLIRFSGLMYNGHYL